MNDDQFKETSKFLRTELSKSQLKRLIVDIVSDKEDLIPGVLVSIGQVVADNAEHNKDVWAEYRTVLGIQATEFVKEGWARARLLQATLHSGIYASAPIEKKLVKELADLRKDKGIVNYLKTVCSKRFA